MERPSQIRRLALALFVGATLVGFAHADVIMGVSRKKCRADEISEQTHGMTVCHKKPPTDCPPGWIGVIGGACAVNTCSADEDCGKGKHCHELDVCVRYRWDRWPPYSPTAVRQTIVVDILPTDGACEEPTALEKGKVCLPNGVTKAGRWKRPAK